MRSANNGRETIAAIATARGGGIGIVRVSGPAAESIVARLVHPWPASAESHKLYRGQVRAASGEVLDDVLACIMRSPRSYTGEDVVELQGHGGGLVLERVLAAVLQAGSRLATPGEFTRRAFEAGKIDLSRAEAVAELIAARSERALRAAQSVHSGQLGAATARLRADLIETLAGLEGVLDFPDEGLELTDEPGRRLERLRQLAVEMEEMAGSYRRWLHGAAEVALVGRVNAGKSSLLNALAGEERALVDPSAGTTRDLVEVELLVGELPIRLVDTAGERFASSEPGELEARGLALAHRRRDQADVVALVVDSTLGFGPGEKQLWAELRAPKIIVWNKRDLGGPAVGLPEGALSVETTATHNEGAASLRQLLAELLGSDQNENTAVVSERQSEALRQGAAAVRRAVAALVDAVDEVAAVELRAALTALGRITGEMVDTAILDAIFARFCIGK